MRVWLDDKRPMPADFDKHVVDAIHAIRLLQTRKVTFISLDHDLGDRTIVGEGNDVAKFIEFAAYQNMIPRLEWAIHSQNPVGEKNMLVALQRADGYWSGHEEKGSIRTLG